MTISAPMTHGTPFASQIKYIITLTIPTAPHLVYKGSCILSCRRFCQTKSCLRLYDRMACKSLLRYNQRVSTTPMTTGAAMRQLTPFACQSTVKTWLFCSSDGTSCIYQWWWTSLAVACSTGNSLCAYDGKHVTPFSDTTNKHMNYDH